MNPLSFIPAGWQVWIRIAVYVLLAAAGAAAAWTVKDWKDGAQLARLQASWNAERAAQAQAVSTQQTRNIELQKAAEKHYVVQVTGQDHFYVQTVTEIRDAEKPLASCPVPDAVRVRLNAYAACARGDSTGACDSNDKLPDAQRPAAAGNGG
jgi:hypothetical protein